MAARRQWLIGRSANCDIVVDQPGVSAQHCRLTETANAVVLEDLGSTNGTRLDGRRIELPEPLEPGDRIEVGASVITFDLD